MTVRELMTALIEEDPDNDVQLRTDDGQYLLIARLLKRRAAGSRPGDAVLETETDVYADNGSNQ